MRYTGATANHITSLIRVALLSIAVVASCPPWRALLAQDWYDYPAGRVTRLPAVAPVLPADDPTLGGVQPAMAEIAESPVTGWQPAPMLPGVPTPTDSPPVLRLPPVDLQENPRPRTNWFTDLRSEVVSDYRDFYSLRSLAALGAGLGVGAVMANTSIDESIRDTWQENVRSARSDEYLEAFHEPKILGDGYYMIPAYAGVAFVGSWFEEGTVIRGIGDWGSGSLRTIGVGAPMMLALQYATGGARPGEDLGSDWNPFQHTHGVSGHAFMGAVPFLTAAKMAQSPFWKTAFYAGSVFPGLSRINDDDHYASQVVLGWWIAYLAASAVDRTNVERSNFTVGPIPTANGVAFGLQWSH